MVVVFCQQGLVAQKKKKWACRRPGQVPHSSSSLQDWVFEEGAGQTPFRTDSVTQLVQGERENQTSFCSFQPVDRLGRWREEFWRTEPQTVLCGSPTSGTGGRGQSRMSCVWASTGKTTPTTCGWVQVGENQWNQWKKSGQGTDLHESEGSFEYEPHILETKACR